MSEKRFLIVNNGKSILVLSSADLIRLEIDARREDAEGKKIRDLLGIAKVTQLPDSLIKKMENAGILEVGSILIQSPYNQEDYVLANQAAYDFAQDKCIHFTSLCSRLAAKRVFAKKIQISDIKGEKIGDADLSTPYANLSFDIKMKDWEKIQKSIKIERKFRERKPDFRKANDYLQKNLLTSDRFMTALVEDASDGFGDEFASLELNASREAEQNLNLAFSLNVPVSLSNLKLNLANSKSESYLFTVEMEVEFW